MPTRIPLRPSLLQRRRQTVKWIILHHTAEMYPAPESRIDNPKYQMPGLYKGVLEKKQADVNYHYVIDMIINDYAAIIVRPFVYLCEWDDIDANINNRAIHVALMGNHDFQIPQLRMYQILAYRVLNPMMRLFNLSPKRIKFHRDLSSDKELTCPGDFIDEGRVIAQVRRFIVK
jgi:hypothetical protein